MEPNLTINPIQAIADSGQAAALAVISGIEGPSYRPLGAFMAVFANGRIEGNLSSGCIEADIATHAIEAMADGKPREIRYGRGSRFIDIKLPCGGGLDILIVPHPDRAVLREICQRHAERTPCLLGIDTQTGRISAEIGGETGRRDTAFHVRIAPEVRFVIFGKGPEAHVFASIVQSIGFPNTLCSPDMETLGIARQSGCATRHLVSREFPADLAIDDRTAITLFFHDHDWEPPLLGHALASPAFYVGAQGSRRTAHNRAEALREMGTDAQLLERLRGPIGLIPSTRDARMLAVSVLAEILTEAAAETA
ncbi:MAG: XdhC family protein [Tropicimonas sp.]|uniref:XdhC family protein n=1 Tax=Tropicimonas sp. TaxID=2067044 RepID=UPI003A8BE2AF